MVRHHLTFLVLIVLLVSPMWADVNAKETLSGMTPVMFAALKGHTAIVKMLIERGASEPDAAVLPAIYFGHTETSKYCSNQKV